jgi:DNA-binding transcriptional regulator YiaG
MNPPDTLHDQDSKAAADRQAAAQTELDAHRPMIETSAKLGAALKTVEKAAEQAKAAADKQAAAQLEVARIKNEWKALFEEHERLRRRILGAKEAIDYARTRVRFERDHFAGYLGASYATNAQYFDRAAQIASRIVAVSIMEEALGCAEDAFNEQKEKMIAFGRDHGIAEDELTHLAETAP